MYYGGHNWRTIKVHDVSTKLKMYPLHYCMITVRVCGYVWWWVSVVWVGPVATKVVELKTDALHWGYCVGACASWTRPLGGGGWQCWGPTAIVWDCRMLWTYATCLESSSEEHPVHIDTSHPPCTHFTVQSTSHETADSDHIHYCNTIWMEQSMLMACKHVGGEWASMCV